MEREDQGTLEQSGIEQITAEVLPDGRMSRPTTAKYIGIASQTLAIWAVKGIGPPPVRVGGRIFYRKRDVDAFIAAGGV